MSAPPEFVKKVEAMREGFILAALAAGLEPVDIALAATSVVAEVFGFREKSQEEREAVVATVAEALMSYPRDGQSAEAEGVH